MSPDRYAYRQFLGLHLAFQCPGICSEGKLPKHEMDPPPKKNLIIPYNICRILKATPIFSLLADICFKLPKIAKSKILSLRVSTSVIKSRLCKTQNKEKQSET